MRALLLSTYELGRQPFGLASPAAWLRDAGISVRTRDLAKVPLDEAEVRSADLVAFYLPMHTATRLAVPLIRRVRTLNPAARLCCYGLYAPLNEPLLQSLGVEAVFGGEFEQDLVDFAEQCGTGAKQCGTRNAEWGINAESGMRNAEECGTDESSNADIPHSEIPHSEIPHSSPFPIPHSSLIPHSPFRIPHSKVPRLSFRVPDRSDLPPLARYATLQRPGGSRHLVGYTEASRGCKHLCRHCPVVPIYGGQFRIVPVDVVLADVGQQVEAGAEHVTFGDPDFFNGIGHALAVVRALAREFPGLTYDATIKVEHLMRYEAHLPVLRETGCLFVTSAVESFDDDVLRRLDKGHTRADVARVVERCRAAELVLAPTFVAFHPWMGLETYCAFLDDLAALDLVEQVAPIQLAIRLLIPTGSRLLDLADVHALVGPFDHDSLAFPWRHPDPRVDALQEELSALVGRRVNAPRREVFEAVRTLADARAGRERRAPVAVPVRNRTEVPYLNEPWYC